LPSRWLTQYLHDGHDEQSLGIRRGPEVVGVEDRHEGVVLRVHEGGDLVLKALEGLGGAQGGDVRVD
jgi:hypothetical protein